MDANEEKVILFPTFNTNYHQGMKVGETKQFKAYVEGAVDEPVHYVSDTPDIVSIDDQGNVTALKEGEGYIAAEAIGKRARLCIDIAIVKKGKVKFIGHRGLSGHIPENTYEAFKAAVDAHFDYIEIPIQVTLDHQMVIFNDKTMRRIFADPKTIGEYTLEEIKLKEFVGGNGLEDYPGVTVPTLKEIFDLVKGTETKLVINLKDLSLHNVNYNALKELDQMIKDYNYQENTLIVSDNKNNIEAFKTINDVITMGYIVEKKGNLNTSYIKEHNLFLSVKYSIVNGELLQKISNEGIEIGLWIVNNKTIAKKLLDYPIKYITTDYVIFDD